MSIRGLLNKVFGGDEEPKYPPGEVTWSVAYDVDDYDGPGWYLSASGPEVHKSHGPFQSKDSAIEAAREMGSPGDELEIWEKEALEPDIQTMQ